MYKAILTMADKKYKGEGETLFDALSDIKIEWQQIGLKGTLQVSDGKKKAEKFYNIRELRKIFVNKTYRGIKAKYLELLMK